MNNSEHQSRHKLAQKKKILLFSYAFPPMQVQMSPTVFKPMAALAKLGYEIDVLCADSFCKDLPLDESLLPFVNQYFKNIDRLNPKKNLLDKLKVKSKVFARIPDLMTVLHHSAYDHLSKIDLTQYEAVITWSPFHSINAVMAKIKKEHKDLKWIAQFSDPWHKNPLEISTLTKLWNRLNEPRAVNAADFIVHSSAYSLDLMLREASSELRKKSAVIPHAYNSELYPQRPKIQNRKITLRYVGVLYGRRSPEPLFKALNDLYERRNDLREKLLIELIGQVPSDMLKTKAALSLPKDSISHIQNVNYIQSLEKMYDADILILIEADIRQNLFLPSKLADYIGADTPIVGLTPPGGSEDALQGLNCWHARPSDINGISLALEKAINYVMSSSKLGWCDTEFKARFSDLQVANQFDKILKGFN